MSKNSYGKILKDGIITQNPVLVQVLGMCPTLAVSTRLMNGLGMGAAVTAVLIFSNLFISLLRRVIDKRIRIASFIVIIAGFVTMVEMLMKAYLPSLSESLGVYIPLIVVNCIILARAEAFASRNKPLPSVIDGLASGLGFTGAICIVSTIREVLGTGALLGYDFKLIPPIMIFTLAPGGLLVLGLVMAFCAWISGRRKAKAAQPAGEAAAAESVPAPAVKKVEKTVKTAQTEASAELDKAPAVKPTVHETGPVVKPAVPEAGSVVKPAVPEAGPVVKPAVPEVGPVVKPAVPETEPVVKPTVPEAAFTSDAVIPSPQGEGSPAESSREDEEGDPSLTPGMTEAKGGADDVAPAAPASDAPVYADEAEHEAALAAALRYFGGEAASSATEPQPETAEAPAPEAPAQLTFDMTAQAPETAPEAPSAEAPAPAAQEETRRERRSIFARRQKSADDDPLEPPSFMSEPVTLTRERKTEKEDGENG